MFSSQFSGVLRSRLNAPEPNSFVTDYDASVSWQIFDISMAQAEAMVQAKLHS
ncbi:MAG: hypothetical protein ACI8P9_003404 [Parasphingorhabdus sp.]